jgi:hypothetical protein
MALSANQPPTSTPRPLRWGRVLKNIVLLLGSTAAAIMLWHGVYMPSFLLKPIALGVEEGRSIEFKAESFVVSMLPSPKVRLINVQINSAITKQPIVHAGLVSLEFNYSQWLQGDLFPVSLNLKQTVFRAEKDAEGDWTLLHLKKLRSDTKRPLRLPKHLSIKDSRLQTISATGQINQFLIDDLQLQTDGEASSYVAIRAGAPNDNAWNAQLQAKLTLTGEKLQLERLEASARGDFLDFPWYATAAIDAMTLPSVKAPSWELQQFRAYVRREDAPDDHQAALSVRRANFEWADGRLSAKKAEWTYTHEQAEAWTFNATVDLALQSIKIRPESISGSEALLAKAQDWRLSCQSSDQNANVWVWQSGWFDLKRKKLAGNAPALLCE